MLDPLLHCRSPQRCQLTRALTCQTFGCLFDALDHPPLPLSPLCAAHAAAHLPPAPLPCTCRLAEPIRHVVKSQQFNRESLEHVLKVGLGAAFFAWLSSNGDTSGRQRARPCSPRIHAVGRLHPCWCAPAQGRLQQGRHTVKHWPHLLFPSKGGT